MPRPGEFTYFEKIGEEGRFHSVNKPFSDDETPIFFMDMGLMFSLLPPPPARVLDCGCGTGWLSYFLARKGYDVVGQDCSSDAITLAQNNPVFLHNNGAIQFICGDFEGLQFDNEFDAVLFYSSLHHSDDERKAIECAYRALKPGGAFLAFEPSIGHKRKSQEFIDRYDLGDRDMPPSLITRRGRAAGFRKIRTFVHSAFLLSTIYRRTPANARMRRLLSIPGAGFLVFSFLHLFYRKFSGVVVMKK